MESLIKHELNTTLKQRSPEFLKTEHQFYNGKGNYCLRFQASQIPNTIQIFIDTLDRVSFPITIFFFEK